MRSRNLSRRQESLGPCRFDAVVLSGTAHRWQVMSNACSSGLCDFGLLLGTEGLLWLRDQSLSCMTYKCYFISMRHREF